MYFMIYYESGLKEIFIVWKLLRKTVGISDKIFLLYKNIIMYDVDRKLFFSSFQEEEDAEGWSLHPGRRMEEGGIWREDAFLLPQQGEKQTWGSLFNQ